VNRIDYRGRLFAILLLFALVPSIVLSLAWAATSWWGPRSISTAAWDSTAVSGARALQVARSQRLSAADSTALAKHEEMLSMNHLRATQAGWYFRRMAIVLAVSALLAFAVLLVVSSRVAGHLSRSLSRPLQELVGWTERIVRAEPIPESEAKRGAPEFELLRDRMREMSVQIDQGRRAALEAERLSALRESARQVAHELKNPLTPIKFAVDRLRRDVAPVLQETVDVLSVETRRLEEMARSFAQFGRLPEGPSAPLDVGELARYTARSSVPPEVPLEISVAPDVPLIEAQHEALARALSNVMLNAVEACKDGGTIAVDVSRISRNGGLAVALSVRDTGCGIPAARLARIWEPYVTYKAGGTGLGLAIARQTVLAHDGEVTAESEPGRGTVIRFILPIRNAKGRA
jgi:two-component system nitrogen regulation sensor histidine kinase NtrY